MQSVDLELSQPQAGSVPEKISDQQVAKYQRDGFTCVRSILTPQEVERYRDAVVSYSEQHATERGGDVIAQWVNLWREDETLRELTLHPLIARTAERLATVPLRLWHDQILLKKPHNQRPTEFHQDRPYWPHDNSTQPISCWIALCDVPVEKGCMSFIPGSHKLTDLPAQDLASTTGDLSFMTLCPQMRYEPRVTLPLKAGDCTFHHGYCAHMANQNDTEELRVAFVNIYIDRAVVFKPHPQGHPVTDPLNLNEGDALGDDMFPELPLS